MKYKYLVMNIIKDFYIENKTLRRGMKEELKKKKERYTIFMIWEIHMDKMSAFSKLDLQIH